MKTKAMVGIYFPPKIVHLDTGIVCEIKRLINSFIANIINTKIVLFCTGKNSDQYKIITRIKNEY